MNNLMSDDQRAKIIAIREAARAKFAQRQHGTEARLDERFAPQGDAEMSAPVSVEQFIAQHGLDGE
ncbi:MAG: hypothetical protein EOP84_33215 [Verrucomicrobiaceae bacterium]|nr:MAG: hypothetical protein EOP84_33215 [Verrucomicrobiaceae bacterium]